MPERGQRIDARWTALEATPAALALLDPDLRLRAITPAAARLLALEPGADLGRGFDEILRACGDREAADAASRAARDACAAGATRTANGFLPIRRAGAAPVAIDFTFAPAGAEVVAHLASRPCAADAGRDLAATLAETERRFALLVESVREYAIIGLDADGRVTSWNRGGERLFGWTADEVLGRDATMMFTPEDRAAGEVERELATALATGQAEDDRWHLRKDGSRFFVVGVLTATRDDDGRLLGFVKIVRDRSGQLLADQRVEVERALLGQVLEQMPVGVSIAEAPSGRLLYHNQRAIGLIGHEMLVGEDYRIYGSYGAVHPDGTPYRADEYPIARALLRGEVVVQEEMPYRRGDGVLVELAVSAAPVRDPRGAIIRAVSTFDDITARKRDREALNRVNRELEEFAYIASHDLQEPLRMVASYLALLRRRIGDGLDQQSAQYVEQAIDGARRMQALVRHLLEFARIDRAELRLQPTAVLQALAGALHHLEPAIDESGAEVAHGDLPTVLGEPVQLVRLFQNLIGNAIKYARTGVPPRVRVTAKPDGARWLIAIDDNGVGIAETDRDRIFRPFERAHGRERYAGTGLGLAICRKIVDRLGGDIRVEPGEGGVGSRFVVTLRALDG